MNTNKTAKRDGLSTLLDAAERSSNTLYAESSRLQFQLAAVARDSKGMHLSIKEQMSELGTHVKSVKGCLEQFRTAFA